MPINPYYDPCQPGNQVEDTSKRILQYNIIEDVFISSKQKVVG